MQDDPSKSASKDDASSSGEFNLEPAGEVAVTHHPAPPKIEEEKKIHPRRPLPAVPEKKPPQQKDDSKR